MILLQILPGCGGNNDDKIPLIPVTGTLAGTITYQDKEYDQNGFTGALTNKAVRFADVEALNAFTNEVLASTQTDAAGSYRLSYTSFFGYPVKLRVMASARISNSTIAVVRNLYGQVYAGSATVLFPTLNINIPVTSPAGGAFNILDVLTSGAEFVHSLAGTYPPPVSAFWKADSFHPVYGTGYCSGSCSPGAGIYIIGDAGGDTDGYDDDVIWHEYGHFIAENYSRDDSQGGTHLLGDNNQDLRLAWSEGWGDFFPGAVKSWLSVNDPARISATIGTALSRYIDTVGDLNQIRLSFDFGDPGGDPYVYSSSEVAVAKVLHDLRSTFDMTEVWAVVDGYIQTVSTPANLEAFWDGWQSIYSGDPAAMTASQGIFNGRNIYYEDDAFEPDDAFGTARGVTLPFMETHYLYKPASDDHDLVSINAVVQQYTVRTINVSNRLSPSITVYDAGGSVQPTGGGGTSITFTPASAGTYYIEVTPALTRPSSDGRYGTYTLTITSP